MPDLPLIGGCLCGGVRFEISAPLVSASYCHCTRCQRRSGTAASPQARVAPGSFQVVRGEELLRGYTPPDGFEKVFCSRCGSSVLSRDPNKPEVIAVRLGAFDGDPGIRPQRRAHVSSAAVWERIPDDGLPRFAGSPPG